LLSVGVPIEVAHGSIRFSFGKKNAVEEGDYTVKVLVDTVNKLREISPLFKSVKGESKYV